MSSNSNSSNSSRSSRSSRSSNFNSTNNSTNTIETLSVSSNVSERVSECEGHKYNVNLVFIGLIFAFLYMRAGVMFPNSDWSKTSLMNGLNSVIPDFKIKK